MNEKKLLYLFEINFFKYKILMIKIKNKFFWIKLSVYVIIFIWILDLVIGMVSILRKGLMFLGSIVFFVVEYFLIFKCFIVKY